ncbi:MAG: VanW family protein [Sorangiineae bacterium]|nr:VanW family protein [Polyangiaceae bacterium]MEB2323414.1 VanW family protein [Sorangiineae bacterium]
MLERLRALLRRQRRGALAVGVAIAAGLGIGLVLVPRAPGVGDELPPAPEVRLLGQPLALDDRAIDVAVERVRRYAARPVVLELPEAKSREVSLGRLGAQIDKLRLSQLVRDARDPTSPLRRGWHAAGVAGPVELPVPMVIEPERALAQLLVLKDELDRLPSDARLDLESRKLIPEVLGRLLDVDASLLVLERAVQSGARAVKLAFEERKPKRVASELAGVKFDGVLGYFETSYDRSSRAAARTFNLRLAASKLDGTVLLPGETFDFNEVVGPRDEANGYKVAPVIAEGELVDGIGGGTCQISGTLHGAAFFAGLEIVERYSHTRPSSYIKMGLDATVVYPTIDFRFRNGFDFPVVLHQTVKGGVVRAEILGPPRTRTVTLIRRIDQAIPYEETERPDKSLPEGVRVLSQRGVPGFRVHRYRIVREGHHAVRERWNDVYPPTTQIIRVGAGDAAADTARLPKGDQHPEYLADELLVTTQGLDVDEADHAPGGATREWREPGKFGKPGWTAAEGMPVWRGDDAGPAAAGDAEQRAAKDEPKGGRRAR